MSCRKKERMKESKTLTEKKKKVRKKLELKALSMLPLVNRF